jgi:hypothetical protein
MKKRNDYISDSHHYWTHFWCGLAFGAGLGAWSGWWLFDSGWTVAVMASVAAIVFGYSCGRWGDRAWHWAIERLPWFT